MPTIVHMHMCFSYTYGRFNDVGTTSWILSETTRSIIGLPVIVVLISVLEKLSFTMSYQEANMDSLQIFEGLLSTICETKVAQERRTVQLLFFCTYVWQSVLFCFILFCLIMSGRREFGQSQTRQSIVILRLFIASVDWERKGGSATIISLAIPTKRGTKQSVFERTRESNGSMRKV